MEVEDWEANFHRTMKGLWKVSMEPQGYKYPILKTATPADAFPVRLGSLKWKC